MPTMSLREALELGEERRQRKAADNADWYRLLRELRLAKLRLEAKLDQRVNPIGLDKPPTSTWQRPRLAFGAGTIQYKRRDEREPVAIPGSSWHREPDGSWTQVG